MLKKEKMSLAIAESKKSNDPHTQVGAVIVSQNNEIIGAGFNQMPQNKNTFPWEREGKNKDTKYPYVVHAEMNACINANEKIKGAEIYVTLFPCSNCAKYLAQAGIKKVYYLDDKYHKEEDAWCARKILKECNIPTEKVTA